uniref:Large ribosomal subunit protein uL18c n=1 Tax=Compsothamnion thuioides TaxID=3097386 RepID=A0A4D6WPE8_9FLOR|nr:ribosomal protein L18 [Compsothamnion thuyoides]
MKKKIIGTKERPRLYVFKSNKHIYAQLIDDSNNMILASSSTIHKNINKFANCTTAKIVGKTIAAEIKKQGLTEIIFDRGFNIYHGKIKALADATREEGIIF